ncbi:FtsX-like permease family protein [Alteromonadaceae bacterium 2753L.S.0a.02]|nr:FtsX-like permease family protein [Alteromonadaceae bacterium 2753L.S.0a.02]
MQDILPAFKILRRKPLGPLLIASQTGLIITILTLLYLSVYHLGKVVWRDSGIDEEHLGVVKILAAPLGNTAQQRIESDLRYLNEMKDSEIVAPILKPLFDTWPQVQLLTKNFQDPNSIAAYTHLMYTNHLGLQTLGAKLLKGRNFSESEVQFAKTNTASGHSPIIISQDTAELLFPQENAVGQYLYSDAITYEIVGISTPIIATNRSGPHTNMSALVPIINLNEEISYLVRSTDQLELSQLQDYRDALQTLDRERVISDVQTVSNLKKSSQANIHFSFKLVSMLYAVLVLICALGIIGLTSFRVASSKRHIAIRRALGATRWQICRYFFSENLVIFVAAFSYSVILVPVIGKLLTMIGSDAVLSFSNIVISGSMVLTVVLLSATYPVLQASRVSPASLSGKLAAKR